MSNIQDLKFTPDDFIGRGISGQPDRVEGQAQQLKAKFDEIAKDMIALGKWNELIDALVGVVQKLDAAVTTQTGHATRISAAELALSQIKDGTVKAKKAVNAETLGGKAENQLNVNRALILQESYTGADAGNIFRTGANSSRYAIYCDSTVLTGTSVIFYIRPAGRSDWLYPVISAGDHIKVSSAKFKRDIAGYDGALDKVLGLEVREYKFEDGTENGRPELGLIADAPSTPPEIVVDMGTPEGETEPTKGISVSGYASLIARALQEHYSKREQEITAAQLAACEVYEEMEERNTAMQLALCEAYEELIGGTV